MVNRTPAELNREQQQAAELSGQQATDLGEHMEDENTKKVEQDKETPRFDMGLTKSTLEAGIKGISDPYAKAMLETMLKLMELLESMPDVSLTRVLRENMPDGSLASKIYGQLKDLIKNYNHYGAEAGLPLLPVNGLEAEEPAVGAETSPDAVEPVAGVETSPDAVEPTAGVEASLDAVEPTASVETSPEVTLPAQPALSEGANLVLEAPANSVPGDLPQAALEGLTQARNEQLQESSPSPVPEISPGTAPHNVPGG